MASNGLLPSTTLLSFEQLCAESDPNFYKGRDHPWIYDFSNGRKFLQHTPWYAPVITAPVVSINALTFGGVPVFYTATELAFDASKAETVPPSTSNNWPQVSSPLEFITEFNKEALCFGAWSLTFDQEPRNLIGYTELNALEHFNDPLSFSDVFEGQYMFYDEGDC